MFQYLKLLYIFKKSLLNFWLNVWILQLLCFYSKLNQIKVFQPSLLHISSFRLTALASFCFHLTILINSSPWFELPWEYEETCCSPSTYPKQQQSCNSLSFPYSFWPRLIPIPLRGYSSTKSFHWSHFLQFSFYQQFWQLSVWLQHQWQ